MPITTTILHGERPESIEGARLLVLLHGYMSNELDLLGLATRLPDDFTIVSLRAPLEADPGYAWFAVTDPGDPAAASVDPAVTDVLEWLDGFVDAHGTPAQVVLLGFSQGGAITTQLMRQAPTRFGAGVVLSGFTIGGTVDGDAVLAETRPPIFWGRDEADPVITPDAIERTAVWLPAHSTLTSRLYPGMAHSVSLAELDDVNAFLATIAPVAS